MDWDETAAARPPKPKDLSALGVADLEAYISSLQDEIARAQEEIRKRGQHRSAADALFRS